MQLFIRCLLVTICFVFSNNSSSQEKNGFDLSDSLIPSNKIQRGGPPRDGIPSIDKPDFVRVKDVNFLNDKDRVLGIYRNGIARAYPIKILNWHEIVNDIYKDEAIVISYCPLCNTGMAFIAGSLEKRFTFGVSGLLYNSDVLLYDRQTGSLWSQIMSKAISGPLKNINLTQISASHTSWGLWRQQYPDTEVLSEKTGFNRNYDRSPYLGYARNQMLMFDVENRNNAYRNKELVLGVTIDNQQKAYPFKELKKNGEENFSDQFANRVITIRWYEKDKAASIFDSKGEEIPSTLAYWFAWVAFYPETEIYKSD